MSIRSDFWKRMRGENTELIPWFGDLSYYYFSLQKRGVLPPKWQGLEGEIRFYQDQKVGFCFNPPFTYQVEYLGGVQYEEKQTEDGIYCRYQTPYGELTSEQKYLPSTFTYGYTKHFVESIEDLKVMAYIFEQMRYHPDYEAFHRLDKLVGEDGLPVEFAPISVAPMQKLISRWAGIETTVNLFMDYPDELEECIGRIEEAQMPVFDVIAGSGAPVIEFPENLTSEVSGSFFKMYNLPYYQRVNEVLHKAGKITGIHIDGTLNPCLSRLHEAGFDFAEAVTPAPVGDVALEDLRAMAGDEIFLWGGLPGAMFTASFSDVQFEEHIKKVLALNDPKTILGVADQVPADAIPERIREVSRIIGRG